LKRWPAAFRSSALHGTKGLFRAGDIIFASNADAMEKELRRILANADLRSDLAARGRQTIEARHTCAHRADELLDFAADIGAPRETTPT